MQGLVAGTVAVALVFTALKLRPGESEFLISIITNPMIVMTVPALWVLFQVLPLGVLAHPIWASAEFALGRPIAGVISIDPGASVIALGQYLSMSAVVFISAAIAVDRSRAEWILFALTTATAAIALIVLTHHIAGLALPLFSEAQAINCASVGIIVAGAACFRAIEHYETRHLRPRQSTSILFLTGAGSAAALVICVTASVLGAMFWTVFAPLCGLATLVLVWIIRRFRLGNLATTAIAALSLGFAILLMAHHLPQRSDSLPLDFAESSVWLKSLSERMLKDTPLCGTGAGTFAALAPIYRESNEPPPGMVAATTAATLAIESGKPMFWIITVATGAFILILLKASLRRGRDVFYPAMGAGCLTAILLLAFVNPGFFRNRNRLDCCRRARSRACTK